MSNNILSTIRTKSLELIRNNIGTNISLFSGLSGDLLLLYELYEIEKSSDILDLSEVLFKQIELNVEQCTSLNFRDGLAGVLFTYAYLSNKKFIDTEDAFYDMFDLYFVEYIDALSTVKDYDLLHGLIGFGIYYVERAKEQHTKKKYVYQIIDKLVNIGLDYGDFTLWENRSEINPHVIKGNKWFYMGNLHGMLSIMSFFIRCTNEGYKNSLMTQILYTFPQLLHRCYDENNLRFSFNEILEDKDGQLVFLNQEFSNLFYCNGDFGFINVLFQLSRLLGDFELEHIAKASLLKLTKRFDSTNEYSSYCLCHGWASLYCYITKFRKCLNSEFKYEYQGKLEKKILEYICEGNHQKGILSGYNGILLSLLSSTKSNCLDTILLINGFDSY